MYSDGRSRTTATNIERTSAVCTEEHRRLRGCLLASNPALPSKHVLCRRQRSEKLERSLAVSELAAGPSAGFDRALRRASRRPLDPLRRGLRSIPHSSFTDAAAERCRRPRAVSRHTGTFTILVRLRDSETPSLWRRSTSSPLDTLPVTQAHVCGTPDEPPETQKALEVSDSADSVCRITLLASAGATYT